MTEQTSTEQTLTGMKPCPFCGANVIKLSRESYSNPPYVFCDNCGAVAPSHNPSGVTDETWLIEKAWNMRSKGENQ